MDNVKKIISIVLVLTISTLIGCTKIEKVENQKLDLFDVFKGRDVAKNYLNSIELEDITKYSKEDIITIPGEGKAGAGFDEYHVNEDELFELVLQLFYKEAKKEEGRS